MRPVAEVVRPAAEAVFLAAVEAARHTAEAVFLAAVEAARHTAEAVSALPRPEGAEICSFAENADVIFKTIPAFL